MPFSRLRKGAFCIFLNPRLNGKPGVVHLYWQLMACGDGCVTAKGELVEVLEFTHFYEHFTFEKTDWSERGKHLKKYIRVIVAVELDTVGAKQTPTSTQ